MRNATAKAKTFQKAILMAFVTLAVLSAIAICTFANAQKSDADISFPNDAWDTLSVTAVEIGPKYLPKDFDTGVTPPPSSNSPQTRDELRELAKNKSLRSKQQEELILFEAQEGGVVQAFISEGQLKPEDMPITNLLVGELVQDIEYFMFRDKLKYRRAAPSQLSDKVSVVGEVQSYPSYPSGHAIMAYSSALLLSELDPRNTNKYMKLADDIAKRREIAGLNYPSDTAAGKQAAVAVYEGLRTQPDLNKLINKAKTEF